MSRGIPASTLACMYSIRHVTLAILALAFSVSSLRAETDTSKPAEHAETYTLSLTIREEGNKDIVYHVQRFVQNVIVFPIRFQGRMMTARVLVDTTDGTIEYTIDDPNLPHHEGTTLLDIYVPFSQEARPVYTAGPLSIIAQLTADK